MKVIGERKAVARRLAELTGEAVVYTRMPRCAYEVGRYTIERDGSITVDEGADLEPLHVLVQEGLAVEELLPVCSEEDEAQSTPVAVQRCVEQDGPVREKTLPTGSEETDEQWGEGERLPMAIDFRDQPVRSEEAHRQDERRVEQPNAQDQPDMCEAEVSVPLANQTGTSIRNLFTMVYSRGALLSKATGGNFACSVELIDGIKDCITVEDAIARLTPDLIGLTIADNKINFVFPATDDADKVQAFTQLAAQMNKAAKKQKRVMAKKVDTTNERYCMRIWLLSLGMGGDEFKTARRVLLAPLSGNAAFKDDAMEQRWKEKRAGERKAAVEQEVV